MVSTVTGKYPRDNYRESEFQKGLSIFMNVNYGSTLNHPPPNNLIEYQVFHTRVLVFVVVVYR